VHQFVLRNLIIICLISITTLVLSSFDSAAQMKLRWDPETDPTVIGYKVYYGPASRTYGIPINVGNVTTHTLNGLAQGVTYYIAVTAYNTANYESDYSNEVSVMMIETISTPNVLTGPTSGLTRTSHSYTAGGSTSSLGNPVQYEFDWNGDGSTNLSPWGVATQSSTWTATGKYNVRARARSTVNTSVVSNWSGSLSVVVSQAAVSCAVATNPSGLQITVDGVTSTAPQRFSWVPGSSHAIAVPSPQSGASGVRYVYASWSDKGAQSHTITVPSSNATYTANLARSTGIPLPPTTVQASDATYTDKVQVTWTASAMATSYTVYRGTSPNTSYAASLGTTSGIVYDDTSAAPGVKYYYWVKASNSFGTSYFSAYDAGSRSTGIPLPPTTVQASDATYPDKVQVTWTASAMATSYTVYRGTSPYTSYAASLGTTSGIVYDDTSAAPGVKYYYWVKTSNSFGTSRFSAYDAGSRSQ
jgi:fibronectin type 3 domain-containing protein